MKTEITISFESEQLDALEFALRKENTNVQSRMEDALRQLYETTVPEAVREYIDSKLEPTPRPRRNSRARQEALAQPIPPTAQLRMPTTQPVPPVTLPPLPSQNRGDR